MTSNKKQGMRKLIRCNLLLLTLAVVSFPFIIGAGPFESCSGAIGLKEEPSKEGPVVLREEGPSSANIPAATGELLPPPAAPVEIMTFCPPPVPPTLPACADYMPSTADIYLIMNYKAHPGFTITPKIFAEQNYGCNEPYDVSELGLANTVWMANRDEIPNRGVFKDLVQPDAVCLACKLKPCALNGEPCGKDVYCCNPEDSCQVASDSDTAQTMTCQGARVGGEYPKLDEICENIVAAYTFSGADALRSISEDIIHFSVDVDHVGSIHKEKNNLIVKYNWDFTPGLPETVKRQFLSFEPNVFSIAWFKDITHNFPFEGNRLFDIYQYYYEPPPLVGQSASIFAKQDVSSNGTWAELMVYNDKGLLKGWAMKNAPGLLKESLDDKRSKNNSPCKVAPACINIRGDCTTGSCCGGLSCREDTHTCCFNTGSLPIVGCDPAKNIEGNAENPYGNNPDCCDQGAICSTSYGQWTCCWNIPGHSCISNSQCCFGTCSIPAGQASGTCVPPLD